MNEIFKDATAVVMAIVGVAILTVIVSSKNQTPQVLNSTFSGLSSLLGVAMGGTATGSGVAGI